MATQMLVRTTSGLREGQSQDSLVSQDAKEIAKFFRGNRRVAGMSVQYAVNRQTGVVVEVVKVGYIAQKDVRELLEQGFDEWLYSWAWAPKNFRLENGRQVPLTASIDVSPRRTGQLARSFAGLI